MKKSIEELLGVSSPILNPGKNTGDRTRIEQQKSAINFSFLFFSDVRKDISDRQKYEFMQKVTLFADREGFEAIYIPERHFHEFGSIYTNPAVMAAYLIPQTSQIRFRTAGISLPLHHPAEVVEWWAMNDVLSGGRVDLGFGSGWHKPDFILAPENYEQRREICSENIHIVQKLWRGESVAFDGPGGDRYETTIFPRPIQKELNVWLLVTQNDEGFIHAGKQGYNIFTMLYGNNLEVMKHKIQLYREARESVGLDPAQGTITLMLHTLLLQNKERVEAAIREPLSGYIESSLHAHMKAKVDEKGGVEPTAQEKEKMLEYAFQRYMKTGGIFGSVDNGKEIVDQAIESGVDEIACLVDFGVDYELVYQSLADLKQLTNHYKAG